MADDSSSVDETPITFNVKSSSDAKFALTLPLSTTVLDVKKKLAESELADIPTERQRLIYSGSILKDGETLGHYKIKDGHTVHLVKSAASNQRQNPTGSAAGGQSAGVPTNFATGTTAGDPLAGLTGARYAGLAQLPGAGMFGPDGGVRTSSFLPLNQTTNRLLLPNLSNTIYNPDGCPSRPRAGDPNAAEPRIRPDHERCPLEPPVP
jgi:ubiquilin